MIIMKKLLFLFLLSLSILTCFAQVVKPGKPAFIVTYDESGKNVNESWNYSAIVKFSLSNWNSWYSENGPNILGREKIVDFDPGLFLKLDPGTVIHFYPSEVDESGSGSNGSYTRVLGTDGVEIITETTSNGTRTIVIDDAAYRQKHNIPTNEVYNRNARFYQLGELAELERTPTGGILRAYTAVGNNLSEWAVSQEAMEQVFPEVETFTLSNKDIQAWEQISRTNSSSGSYEDESISVTLSVKMKSERAEVTLEGCSEMGAGEEGRVTAKGTPAGGTYEFWVDPSDLMTVEASGSTATLKGKRPGRGTLYVEYTSPDGTRAEASKPAAMVRIYDYNGGEPIPQIPLYDIDGKKLQGKLTIAYGSMPDEAQELVDFVSGNTAVFTASATADNIDLLGMKPGKTTLEARDNCGNVTGPTVEVEVVNCDDETIARLEKQKQAATENLQIAARELQKTAGSKEFEKARDDLVASTGDLLVKVGVTIVAGGKAPTPGVATAAQLANDAVGLSDMLASGSHEELFINGVKAAAGKIWGAAAGTLANLESIAEAADRFYKNISETQLHEEAMKSSLESWDKAIKALEDVVKRQQLCKRDKTQPQTTEEPKADPTPEPAKPTPPEQPKPKTDTPPSQEQPTEEPTNPEPGDEEPPISPPPPTSEPRQVGLPYSPEECGCGKTREISLSTAGFSALQNGVKNLGECVERFNKTSVADYTNALTEFSELTKSLQDGASGMPDLFLKQATEAKPKIDSLIRRINAYDEAGKAFLGEFEKCPESVKSGMDVLKSALTVTIDSITTKY